VIPLEETAALGESGPYRRRFSEERGVEREVWVPAQKKSSFSYFRGNRFPSFSGRRTLDRQGKGEITKKGCSLEKKRESGSNCSRAKRGRIDRDRTGGTEACRPPEFPKGRVDQKTQQQQGEKIHGGERKPRRATSRGGSVPTSFNRHPHLGKRETYVDGRTVKIEKKRGSWGSRTPTW